MTAQGSSASRGEKKQFAFPGGVDDYDEFVAGVQSQRKLFADTGKCGFANLHFKSTSTVDSLFPQNVSASSSAFPHPTPCKSTLTVPQFGATVQEIALPKVSNFLAR